MTVEEIIVRCHFEVLSEGDLEKQVTEAYCCDLLSIAMRSVPEGAVWCTVMSNVNTLAVAALTDAACIVLCENMSADEALIQKAKEQEITVLRTDKAAFKAGLAVYKLLNEQ